MKAILLPVLLFSSFAIHAQYYYNDIVGTNETNRLMKTYVSNKVRTVSATGFDQRGSKNTDFSEFHEVKENGTALKSSTFNNLNKTMIYSRFDNQGRVVSVTDSSTIVQSATIYQYDASGRVSKVQNTTKDPGIDFSQTEVHLWQYNAAGKPEKMWHIINNTDSLEIRFVSDENGNPVDERTYKRGVETSQYYYYYDGQKELKYVQTGSIYYYYDENNRLTDIVRYNLKAARLMPDVLFEYDDKDRVIQKITTTSSLTLGYLIWRYVFDEKGLKTKEATFNKEKQLTGKIEYSYTFGN